MLGIAGRNHVEPTRNGPTRIDGSTTPLRDRHLLPICRLPRNTTGSGAIWLAPDLRK